MRLIKTAKNQQIFFLVFGMGTLKTTHIFQTQFLELGKN